MPKPAKKSLVPLQTRVDPEIAQKVKRIARKSGTSYATWLRQVVLAEIEKQQHISVGHKDLNRMVGVDCIPTGIPEIDRVLGGGYARGKLHLLGAWPGVGKTSLLFRTMIGITADGMHVLVASGEMTEAQNRAYLRRICDGVLANTGKLVDKIDILSDTNGINVMKAVEKAVERKAHVLIVESVQLAFHPDCGSDLGSAPQCKAVMEYLKSFAEKKGVAVVAASRLNKQGGFAGGPSVASMADVRIRMDKGGLFDDSGEDLEGTDRVQEIWTEDEGGRKGAFDFLMVDDEYRLLPLPPNLRRLYDVFGERVAQRRREREAIADYKRSLEEAAEEKPRSGGLDGAPALVRGGPKPPKGTFGAKKAPKDAPPLHGDLHHQAPAAGATRTRGPIVIGS